uniref:ATP-binding protein n=1 Tax=[Lactobacillus] rogosae TaxID=706562 RepID=UPI003FED53A9
MSRGNNKSSIAAEGTQWYGNVVSSTLQAYYEVYYVNLSDNTCKRIYPWYIEDNEFIDYTNEVNRRISGNIICNNSEEDVSTLLAVDNLKCELKHKDKTEYRYKRQVTNGVFRWCLVSVVVEKRKNGEPISVILMIRDIEDVIKKEIEQQLLIEEALAQAESASRAKGKFLSDMSHEIRTPMNVILGYASIAQNNMDNRDQDKVKDCLEKIKEAGNHLIGIINDVLEVSRIEQGKINIENEESDIYELMIDFYNLVEIQAAVKKQKMTIDLEGITDKYVYMDWTRISQVLINLINNAIKYTPVGGHIDVIVKEDCNNNIGDNIHNYIIIVKDNGRGIDEKDMPSLFDLYTRGAYDNDISVEGTGLGLSISKQIIELMNGTIDVDSKLGEGTTFTVKLPLQYVVRTQDDKNVTDNGKDNNIIKNDQSLSDIKVMVVDDNQYNREIACELLRENGAHIIECASGSEAVDYIKYRNGIVDIILMDVCMPDMDGFEATRLIRQLEKDRWQDIPIVAMTANAFDEDRKKALEHGMNGHIAKPFDIDTFAETVLEYVKY